MLSAEQTDHVYFVDKIISITLSFEGNNSRVTFKLLQVPGAYYLQPQALGEHIKSILFLFFLGKYYTSILVNKKTYAVLIERGVITMKAACNAID